VLLILTLARSQKVRLVGGPSAQEGRLEVYHNGTWGTVCDNRITTAATRVVCSMLGFGYEGQLIGNRYGAGSGPIWLDDVHCIGTERGIGVCRHREWGRHNCNHHDDVSVSCRTPLRLAGGTSPREGRLEVYYNGTWGTVCDEGFTNSTATVVCYVLGFGYVGQVTGNHYGVGSGPIWLNNVRCNGTETNIGNCRHGGWDQHSCVHSQDLSVSCYTSVRLVDGPSPREGRLEVYHNRTWKTVCNNRLNLAAARAVCYMLGYEYTGRFCLRYGVSSRPILLDDLHCNGTETDIGDCRQRERGPRFCTHGHDVSVSCPTPLRLVGGPSSREGRLEVHHNGTWGTVCDDGFFTHAAARVVCYMLGFGYVGQVIGNRYGVGSGPIWLDNVECRGVSLCERLAGVLGHYGGHTRPQVADRGMPSRSGTRG